MRRNFIHVFIIFAQCVILVLAGVYLWSFYSGNLKARQELIADLQTNSVIGSGFYKESTEDVASRLTEVFTNITSHEVDDFIEQEQIMADRLKAIHDKCQILSQMSEWKEIKPHGMVINYDNLHYCFVPKVGCTYWKRIFLFLSGDYPQDLNIRRPLDIDRYFIHYSQHKKIKEFVMHNEEKAQSVSNNAFMFARDPYSRLWSAYVDKFVLPDYWVHGREIGHNESRCLSGLTFEQFLTAITEIWPKRLDDHWEPIYLMCNPCHLQFAVVGKMENFAKDADFVFKRFNIRLDMNVSKREMALEEIKTLAKYNFNIEQTKFKYRKDCFFKMDVAHRLWKAFQYNGYIDRHTSFPAKEFEDSNFNEHPTETFVEIATKTIDRQTEDIKSQKRNMMLEAYAAIPKDLMGKIADIYKYDFELFDYDKELFK